MNEPQADSHAHSEAVADPAPFPAAAPGAESASVSEPKAESVTAAHPTPSAARERSNDPLEALLHEWFVAHNPIYLASAAMVLGGLWLVWRDLGSRAALGGLGVAAVAELYALALIGSAAVLRSLGQRRVAVMLGLLAALYQCDVTLVLETCSFLGTVGAIGTIAWIGLFALKLHLSAMALGLRLSPAARWVPIAGAAAVALLPQIFRLVAVETRGPITALAVFAVGASALWTSRRIECPEGFDYRGRRAVRGVGILWAVVALLHVVYWRAELGVSLASVWPVAPLLVTRIAPRERHTWFLVGLALVFVGVVQPGSLALTSLMAAVVLALNARRAAVTATRPPRARVSPPYRGAAPIELPESDITTLAATPAQFARAPEHTHARLMLGALLCLYLSASTIGARDLWTPHQPLLDLALFAVCGLVWWKRRRIQSLAPLAPVGAHAAIQLGWLTTPRAAAEWGAWSIALGFASLGAAVGISWHLQRARETRAAE